ncbi:aldose 1-epimerase family protein [Enterococcus columbae]|uniref:Aldose 1-epimerase n=1 Tax=Enterococcus columbae DSM 7374 = ATCC 51263 TaxID=1121865 RepID=S0KYB5_9ENTE|nr:aldose 1-epimerase family protein [Enterococcus columbae]EOT44256.1 hypothetical protein OMW_00311 [Enterococcus columbae DSM 7374 = ATCC 51263]EOW84414.1 hypothetical protein I568_00909 [Enterococcus columbae DSM 7374 = ATCC 51263]OJG26026.1 hypothetical protein RR47_GL000824 [Enterococcus columbae DSM 7374 = ATCC 51263]
MYSIQNQYLKASFESKGAELQSLFHLQHQIEYLWQADPNHWGKHAPILFPIVGALKDNRYQYEQQSYSLSRHGFARDMIFSVVDHQTSEITFCLKADEQTHKHFPFLFELYVSYHLVDESLIVEYKVVNSDEKPMYYGIGGHPAFNAPLESGLSFEDYQLIFEKGEFLKQIPLVDNCLDLSAATQPENTVYPLSHELFKNDALVFETTQDEVQITLQSLKGKRKVRVSYRDLPFVGLWSTYPVASNFVCIEPWASVADVTTTNGQLVEKYGIQTLNAKQAKHYQYIITVK